MLKLETRETAHSQYLWPSTGWENVSVELQRQRKLDVLQGARDP